MPEPGDPQSLNRYGYVLNNSLKYTDPTGHDVGCPGYSAENCGAGGSRSGHNFGYHIAGGRRVSLIGGDGYSTQQKRQLLLARGNQLKSAGHLTSLEKFARLTDYASSFYRTDDTDNFMLDTSYVILGWSRPNGMYNITPNRTSDWLQPYAFRDWSGWSDRYSDRMNTQGNNQMYHFWFYVAVSYFDGAGIASIGNILHETPIHRGSLMASVVGERFINDGSGVSEQDRVLGHMGVFLGACLKYSSFDIGVIPAYPVRQHDIGNWLRVNLGGDR